ncbi:ATP-binding response regulator [Paraburkholderia ultramafica]|uniref:ATP-binding response regulator n=1 Tax=Paraburkholderia ultramafica TaxID=1544867 RepID=UPI001FE2B652|nr:hybrid sensor histidine kinase/response regulator [Paraburkholderia ultramafica]
MDLFRLTHFLQKMYSFSRSMEGRTLPNKTAAEQVEVLFGSVTPSVLAGALLSVMLVSANYRLGFLNLSRGLGWIAYIAVCASSHIALRWFYKRSDSSLSRWRYWAIWFTAISLAEGVGWGWAAVGLATDGGFEAACLTVIPTLGLAAGSIPAYSPYLPAFLALFLPATVPYALVSFVSNSEIQRLSAPMALLFTCVVGGLGLLSNRALRQRIGLKIRTEELAVDLSRQKEIAEEANRAKSSFLAAASHDLRQPVHALSLFVGALRQIPLPPNAERLVEQIDASTTAMDSLFAAMLDISRLNAGVMAVHRRPFAIGSILERVCLDYVGEAAAKGITLTCVRCSAIVDSDPTLIERIARNLLANAVRYTDSGRIIVGCRRRQGRVVMQIWDTGRGIPHDKHERIFLEYYQFGNLERDREKGLGLGLAIVRRLADLLGCTLALRSEPGQGSCFELSIAQANSAATPSEVSPGVLRSTPATGLVVVIDDEQAIRAGMSSLLTGWGYEVVAAGSANEAIQLLCAHTVQPDLLICDFRLRDGENGIEAIEQLRAEYNADVPAMLITGDLAANRLLEAKASGLALLHKPVPNGKLRAAITHLIATGAEIP